MKCLVTVGSTRFDDLVATSLSPSFLRTLSSLGFTSLTIQHGASPVPDPAPLPPRTARLTLHLVPYTPSLPALLSASDLVVSHAGAGSIAETLRTRAALVIVPNEGLMDNHQRELAEAVEAQGGAVRADVKGLVRVVGEGKWRETVGGRKGLGSGRGVLVEAMSKVTGIAWA
jgi:beta-1,4-N-acetylglucosaminyltransferase